MSAWRDRMDALLASLDAANRRWAERMGVPQAQAEDLESWRQGYVAGFAGALDCIRARLQEIETPTVPPATPR